MCDLTRKTTQKIGHSTCTEIILNILTKKEKKKLINFWNKDSKKPKIPLKDPNGPPPKMSPQKDFALSQPGIVFITTYHNMHKGGKKKKLLRWLIDLSLLLSICLSFKSKP